MQLRIKLYSPACCHFPSYKAVQLGWSRSIQPQKETKKLDTLHLAVSWSQHLVQVQCPAPCLTPGPLLGAIRLEPVDLLKQPRYTARAIRSKKITSETIQMPPCSSPVDLGYVLSTTQSVQRKAVQHQGLGAQHLCHQTPSASLGDQMKSPTGEWKEKGPKHSQGKQNFCGKENTDLLL